MSTANVAPWLVREAAIVEARGEEPWAKAMLYVTEKTGGVEGSEHAQAAVGTSWNPIEAKEQASPRRQDEDACWLVLGGSPF